MITFQEARQIAEAKINKYKALGDDSLIIIDDQTIEKDYAWIFFYTSKKYWETNNINYAIGGNGPLFISKLDGQVSNYRTGLSIEETIDKYEEDNKIWNLTLTDNIFTDTNKIFAFREVLRLTIVEVADYKKTKKVAIESGSRARLLEIQKQLTLKGITTRLVQRTLGD